MSVFMTPDIRYEIRSMSCFFCQFLFHLDNNRLLFLSFFFSFFDIRVCFVFLHAQHVSSMMLFLEELLESIRQGIGIESSVVMLISVQKRGKGEKKYDTHFLPLSRWVTAIALSSTFVSFRWKLPSLSWERDVARRRGESTRRRAVTITLG